MLRRRIRSAADVVDIESNYRPSDLLPAGTILGCLRHAAATDPDKPAVIQVEAPDLLTPTATLTYQDLVADVEASADLFHTVAGARPSVVGIMLPMIPEGLTALWGAQAAGVAVPLNPFLDLEPVAAVLNRTAATVLLTTRAILEAKGGLSALRVAAPGLVEVLLVNDVEPDRDLATRLLPHGRGVALVADEDPWRDALVMPTGGTTGAPKLVRMSQAGQLRVAWNVGALMGNEADTVTAHGMPNFHCGGSISLGLRTLLFGGTLLTLTQAGFRAPEVVESFWDVARRFRVTSVLATPTTALALLHGEGSSSGCVVRDFHCGGSAVPMELVRGFHERFGIWLRENWGMTELHGTTTGHFGEQREPRVGSVGQPLPFVRVKSVELDEEGRWVRDCRPGERGVLLIGSPTTVAGYLDPDLDREFFPTGLPDDLPRAWRWANTGDLGSVDDDGYVWVFGRAKDLIIRGGHNIDPREVEEALAAHPGVHLAAAVGRPDLMKGELPIAYVEAREGIDLDPAELLDHCRTRVHERAAVPVEVVVLDRIPLTPVGKVSKPALRDDAILRVVREIARGLDPRAEISIDRGGRRLVVDTVVHDELAGRQLREALVGFTFASRIHVAETAR
ncbi:AMP-binding protein [Nocardioides sp. J54]|uniref:AMP-binding protein n=1 Tax=Nocardioides sp. J54 TaxID=935866 RepID=UPI0004B07B7C|nr:AMP-binding protein [Nocardioides sp. J54]